MDDAFSAERRSLAQRIAAGTPIRDPRVVEAFTKVPRHRFVPPSQVAFAEFVRKDPWGGDYEIRKGERLQDFEVVSAGPDRKFGTEDDISSRKLGEAK